MAVELPVIHSTPAPKRGPDSDPERERLFARARLLARGGLAWHGVEAAVAIAAGAVAGSIALIAFGADSLIEALAGIIVLWRFAASRVDSEHAERRAQQLIAITFWLLAAYVTVDATITLATADHPASSPVGIGLSIVTLIAMPLLANAKANVAKQLGSSAGHSESRQNLLCAYLSAALLVGLTLNAVLGWWWADPTAALIIAAVAAREGRESWRGESCCTRPTPGGGTHAPTRGAPRLRLVASRAGAALRTQVHRNLLGRCRDQHPHLSAPASSPKTSRPAECAIWKQFQITHMVFTYFSLLWLWLERCGLVRRPVALVSERM